MPAAPPDAPRFPALAPASDRTLRVAFDDRITPEAGRRVLRLLRRLDRLPLEGIDDLSPAYASILIRFDPRRVTHERVRDHVLPALADLDDERLPEPRLVEVPVRYGGDAGPDLEEIARRSGLSPGAVVALHVGTIYEVHFLGFTPGFAYMGTVPEAIACPRLDAPRRSVPAGSVGIAGSQTGIYPCATPGGWRLIGRTSLTLFDPRRSPMSLLGIGDRVRFVPDGAAGEGPAPGAA